MSSNKSVETSALAGVACGAIFYGAYLIIFPICMFLLLQKRLKGIPVHWALICAIITQFFTSTIYISVQLGMAFQSYVNLQSSNLTLTTSTPLAPSGSAQSITQDPSPTWWNTPPIPAPTTALLLSVRAFEPILSASGSPNQQWSPVAKYWLDTHAKLQLLSSAVCFANIIIGDSIIVWRLYVVWGRRWIVCALPIASLTAGAICSVLMVSIESTSIYSIVDNLGMATWGLSVGTQLLSTLLVAFKLRQAESWSTDKSGISMLAGNPYKKIMWIIVESGAIYTTMALVLLILYSIGQTGPAVVLMGCVGQVSAIIPATIVILLHSMQISPSPSVSTRYPGVTSSDHKMVFASARKQSTHSDDELSATSTLQSKEIY
ncbi:hypothetical protein BDQ17DRAFT_1420708 [Cyathus striatus]|nr:hypothetical protein BDQ17DRAFT_1420708 [Cyathus striatus]